MLRSICQLLLFNTLMILLCPLHHTVTPSLLLPSLHCLHSHPDVTSLSLLLLLLLLQLQMRFNLAPLIQLILPLSHSFH